MRLEMCKFIICFFVVLLATAYPAFAQSDKLPAKEHFPVEMFFDGKKIRKDALFDYFYNAAFSARVPDHLSPMPKYGYDFGGMLGEKYPALYPLTFHAAGVPEFMAINKWAGPVEVTFGHSRDAFAGFAVDQSDDTLNGIGGIKTFVQQASAQINQIAATIKAHTGVDISLAEKNISTQNAGRIHIVFSNEIPRLCSADHDRPCKEGKGERDFLQKRRPYVEVEYGTVIKDPAFPSDASNNARKSKLWDNIFPYAVTFTPENMKQVDGYFVTNDKNEIQLSVCYLPMHPAYGDRFIGLLNECLMRSMGLPGAIREMVTEFDPPSVLSYWGDDQQWSPRLLINSHSDTIARQNISSLDWFLLETLYHPSVHAGMTVKQVYNLFALRQK
jgi:hypothetical protein